MALPRLGQLGARERWGLGLALLALVLLGLDQLVVRTVRARLTELDEAIAAQSVALGHQVKVLASRDMIAAEYARTGGQLAADLSEAEAVDVIKGEIDDLARETGVVLVAMEHRAPVAQPSHTTYLIDIRKFESSTESLLTFLGRLWESPGMLRVHSVTVTPGAEAGLVEGSLVISKVLAGEIE